MQRLKRFAKYLLAVLLVLVVGKTIGGGVQHQSTSPLFEVPCLDGKCDPDAGDKAMFNRLFELIWG